ncbi:MAG: tRNA 2-selenouridine(34) synthase MnmH [Marinilabiliales bacterium]|nr:MAG: tRNA 2-selenouridine(34) synthase MnmH [Marinilabiliales bacterium]
MPERLRIEDFLPLTDNWPVIDVRSPNEYVLGHIPGAVNIPLFDDEERAAVGTRFKQGGNENAVMLGLEIVGPKLAELAKQAKKEARKKRILIYCWRGGARSASMAWLFETAGLHVSVLEGGYKAYRRFIREQFSNPAKMVVLCGFTGSGKTDILKQLEKLGEQFLDIEGIAHHKGSAFGRLGQPEQPTNEQFENNLAAHWRAFNFDRTIWVEDESRVLGNCSINDPLFKKMRNSILIKIILPKSERAKRLVREYGKFDRKLLIESIEKIRQRMGGLAVKQASEALDAGDLFTVANLTLTYYDKAYNHQTADKIPIKIIEMQIEKDEPEKTAARLKMLTNELTQF